MQYEAPDTLLYLGSHRAPRWLVRQLQQHDTLLVDPIKTVAALSQPVCAVRRPFIRTIRTKQMIEQTSVGAGIKYYQDVARKHHGDTAAAGSADHRHTGAKISADRHDAVAASSTVPYVIGHVLHKRCTTKHPLQ